MENPHAFAFAQLDRLLGFFPRNDGKASFLFASDLGMLALMAVNFPYKHPHTYLALIAATAVLLIGLSLSQLWGVFMPDTAPGHWRSILFFRDIAATSATDYRRRIEAITPDELLEDLTVQIHRNAEILHDKYERLRAAMQSSSMAVLPWLVFLGLAAAQSGGLKIGGG